VCSLFKECAVACHCSLLNNAAATNGVKDRRGVFKLVAFVAALDWVAANAKRPAVASLSLGVPAGQWSRALEEAVKGLVASGVPVVVAAGNDAQDSCQVRRGSVVTRSD